MLPFNGTEITPIEFTPLEGPLSSEMELIGCINEFLPDIQNIKKLGLPLIEDFKNAFRSD